ncbi:hypothetical protein FRC17_007921 [Serendipita sp. 399]|nr:hypothetical protein FRC17_007921 [Serendipita sp. 399]
MRVTDSLASTPVKRVNNNGPTTPTTSPRRSIRLKGQITPAQESPSSPPLVTPPASPVHKSQPRVLATPNSSPKRSIGTSVSPLKKQGLKSSPTRIQRDSDDRWIRRVRSTENAPEAFASPHIGHAMSSEDVLQALQTVKSILRNSPSSQLPLKRRRIGSDEDERRLKRARREVTNAHLMVPLGESSTGGETQGSRQMIHDHGATNNVVNIETMEYSASTWASSRESISHEEDVEPRLPSTWGEDSHLVADMIRPVETAKEVYDEARWALHFYHARVASGDKPQLIQQAQVLLANAQAKWNERADFLVRNGKYHQLVEILASDETPPFPSFAEAISTSF